ncbi:MAG: glycoside hydrolase family 5 protein, partial [candidate division KSB1 bacterium]|nr:glycoside hydrolase family 5 protein [candidate division KSB1 bacterium]
LKTGPAMGGAVTLSRIGGGEAVMPLRKTAADPYRFTAFAKGYVSTTVERTIIGDTFIQFSMLPPQPPADFTSNWHGFNLLGFFTLEWSNDGYYESDFQMISEFGFNFVRLPIDYRIYTKTGDWNSFIEAKLQQIDRAVEWGQKYGIHVCINLHRAPGYCVNPPSTPLPPNQNVSLWNNASAQQAFAAHWRMFAERYRNVPREALSFNLVNEPGNVSAADYVKAVAPAIEAIRAVSPDRIIISDAVDYGNARTDPILAYNVVMSPHFYNPMQITHYKAEWISGADSWPVPTWPPTLVSNYFYGFSKSPWNTPLVIKGAFPAGTVVTIHVLQVSYKADFRAYLGKEQIYQKVFQPGPGAGEWKEVIYRPEWNVYQNIYDRDYSFTLPKSSEEISFRVLDGDWMTWTELRFEPPAGSDAAEAIIQPGIADWGVPQATFHLENDGSLLLVSAPKGFEDKYKLNGFLQQWVDLKNSGVPVHVGEWGVYNKTPHNVTLAFMENRLLAMKWAGLGWALWEFRGSFGILDSGRKDVKYEDYRGHKLDRKMLELLQRYK